MASGQTSGAPEALPALQNECLSASGDKKQALNHNIKLGLAYTALEIASTSVRSGDCMSAFIFLKTGSNSWVGYVQGVNGIMQMVAAFPSGYLCDVFRRDSVLKAGAVLGLAAGTTLATVLLLRLPIWTLFVAMASLGSYSGFQGPAIESIFADSVSLGESSLYTWKHIVQTMSFSAGPMLSIVMFLYLGDVWTPEACRSVIMVGVLMMLPPLVVMLFFDDGKTLGDTSEALTPAASYQVLGDAENQAAPAGLAAWLEPHILIPALISCSDLAGSLASGMTLKFFSLFFMQICEMSPVSVALISLCSSTCISLAAAACQRISARVGRLQINLLTRMMDVALLLGMAALPSVGRKQRIVLVGMHLLRMAAGNAGRPLMRSLLMDNVSKKHRGKINALDSVRAMSWSGSAALGGLLIERYGFEWTFVITAGIKSLSFLFLVPMLSLVPDGICRTRRIRAQWPPPDSIVVQEQEGLREPLLVGVTAVDRSAVRPPIEAAEKHG